MLEEEIALAEETARAMRELADTVTYAPPLRLAPRRRARRGSGLTLRDRWVLRAVPFAAAVAVIALALALVTIRDIPDGSVVPPTSPKPTPSGVPTYYAALIKASGEQTAPEQIVIGETLTGKRVATIAPPAGTTFAGITGAADDRTFVVDTQPGSLDPESEPWQPRTWYLLRIDPGAANSATLTSLPIPETAAGTDVNAIAISPDGTELAVAQQPNSLSHPDARVYLRVYSVASGAVLRSWSSAAGGQFFGGTKYSGPDSNLALAWIGQVGLVFAYSKVKPGETVDGSQVTPRTVVFAQIRVVSFGHEPGGDLLADSRLARSLTTGARKPPSPLSCGIATVDRIVLAGDQDMLVCTGTGEYRAAGPLNSDLCAAGPAWNRLGLPEYGLGNGDSDRTLSQYATRCIGPLVQLQALWSDPSGDTQLGFLGLRRSGGNSQPEFGQFKNGAFHPLPTPPTESTVQGLDDANYIAW